MRKSTKVLDTKRQTTYFSCGAIRVWMSFFLLTFPWLLLSDELDILRMKCGLSGDSGFRHGLVASAWPTFTDQDMLFRDIDNMRDSPAFTEWAMVLFNRWALPDYLATLEDDDDVCSRDLLRTYALSVPADYFPHESDATRFWLSAWWSRLYGPLLSFDRMFRLLRDSTVAILGRYCLPLLVLDLGFLDPGQHMTEQL